MIKKLILRKNSIVTTVMAFMLFNNIVIADTTVIEDEIYSNNSNTSSLYYLLEDGDSLSISGSSYSNNYRLGSGSIIYNTVGTVEFIKDSTFLSNSVDNGDNDFGYGIYGGIIYNEGLISSISNTSFISNSASVTGYFCSSHAGAIFNEGSITVIDSYFENNSAIGSTSDSDYTQTYGGAISNFDGAYIGTLKADFVNNYAVSSDGSYGGAIYNYSSTIGAIIGDFIGNNVQSKYSNGGAIYNSGTISSIEGNFLSNYIIGSTKCQGGAIFNSSSSASITFVSTYGNNYLYLDNYASTDSIVDSDDDENGGFMYNSGTATFNTASNSSITIGDGSAGYDSIAGSGIINKTGAGTLTVNSSMQYFTGTLNVQGGLMEVNNFLGAKTIDIDSGATLSLTISDDNILTNESLSITNGGTLKLVAGINTTANAEYAISLAGLDFDSDGIGAIAYGGSVSGNTFTVGDVISVDSTKLSSTEVSAGSTIKITDSVTSSVVTISTSSSATSAITVSSASDLTSTLTSIDDKEVLTAWSFTITDVDATDGVVLSFLVSDVEDVTLLQLLHRDDESSDWEIITGGTYDADSDLYSVVVYDFCDYALVAVPEPATYAMIFGALALGLAVYRRRK